jgi:hypothetical protein
VLVLFQMLPFEALELCFRLPGMRGAVLNPDNNDWWQLVQLAAVVLLVLYCPVAWMYFMGWMVSLLVVLMWHLLHCCVPLCSFFSEWQVWQ